MLIKQKMKPRQPRSTEHVDAMCTAALKFMTKYPLITEHSIAKTMGWTQSGLQRAFKARDWEIPNKGFRTMSVEQAILNAVRMEDGFLKLDYLMDDIRALEHTAKTGNLCL